ncbi:helix-turn-helix domain-containing protein [Moellerella wisconsensis]|uniref:HTH cro/C1-type domain-containing protein n=1 Tax=Moellerella wisconsensis ATCC 35017 TaxID=1354267 RepID=A0A0N0IB37_9GAMM|nr:helix-turn-helix transcriptional regulator [Moellerella wisconsensis]KPD03563.1 hypothetical protein M992_1156 [Moellerella wisconsensis ATCC 35017]VFS51042.1 transcriptional regulator, y4mF family [Moellerella wisconsensis]
MIKNENTLYRHISCLIRNARKEKKISGADMAKKLGISQQQYSRYERGVNNLKLWNLLRIIKILNIEIKEIIDHIDNDELDK